MKALSIRFQEARLDDLASMRAFITKSATRLGGKAEPVSELKIAVNEAVTNIILHGYREEPGFIEIIVERKENDIRLRLLDSASAFDPTSVPAPDITLPLEKRPYGGMGVQMMRTFTDELIYRLNTNGMNELVFIKHNAASQSATS